MATEKITISKINAEKFVNDRSLLENIPALAKSIEEQGQLQAVGVIPDGDGYALVWGFRRFAAIKSLGKTQIEAKVIKAKASDVPLIRLTENVQRDDLALVDQAKAYKALVDGGTVNVTRLADILGKSKGHVSQVIKLAECSPKVLDNVEAGTLSFTAARSISALATHAEQDEALTLALGWVKAIDEAAEKSKAAAKERAAEAKAAQEKAEAEAKAKGEPAPAPAPAPPSAPVVPEQTPAKREATKNAAVADAVSALRKGKGKKDAPKGKKDAPKGKKDDGKGKKDDGKGKPPVVKVTLEQKVAEWSAAWLAAFVATEKLTLTEKQTEFSTKLLSYIASNIGAVVFTRPKTKK